MLLQKGEQIHELLHQLDFDNTSQVCHGLIKSQCKTENVMNFPQVCRNVEIYKYKAKVAAIEI